MQLANSFGRFFFHFIMRQKWKFFFIQIGALAWALDQIIWPYLLKILIDEISNFNGDKQEIFYHLKDLLILGAGLWLFLDILYRVNGIVMSYAQPEFEAQIRTKMVNYVLKHSHHFFVTHFTGNISNKISDMATSASRIMQMIIFIFIPVIVTFLMAVQVFLMLNIYLSLTLGIWLFLHAYVSYASAKPCNILSDIRSESRSNLNGKIVDIIANIFIVRAFARFNYEKSYVKKYQVIEQNHHFKLLIFQEWVRLYLAIISFLGVGVALTYVTLKLWQQNIISVGDVVLVFNTAFNITSLAWIAGTELPNLYREWGNCSQALSILKEPIGVRDIPNAPNLNVKSGNIKFDNVSFSHDKNEPFFENINLEIKAGQRVGLVGHSGAGKTSFTNLLLRLYDLESGKIFIDGQDIALVTQKSLHEAVAVITQDSMLFHRSIKENIGYGKHDATQIEIEEAAKIADAYDFIMEMSEKFETNVGERGSSLSGGQRQRVIIARAALKNSPILILDEATSALDSASEKKIQEAMFKLMKGKTTLIIAHKLANLINLDRILVFDKGKIVEDGTHKELLDSNGYYAKLWEVTAGGYIL